MKKCILTFIAFFLLIVLHAQDWQAQWISAVESKSDTNIWQVLCKISKLQPRSIRGGANLSKSGILGI